MISRAVAGVLVLLAACGGGGGSSSTDRAPTVVPGPATAWSSITVTGETSSADVPAELRGKIAPLLATRGLTGSGALAEYGLERPRAHLLYTPAAAGTPPAEVDIGSLNFDRHFVYVQRRGSPTVYLVPADSLRPVLALVGIEDTPPD